MAIVRWWARGAIGANLRIVSVYITTFYSFARSLLSALYCHTVMIIANLVKVLGGLVATVMHIVIKILVQVFQTFFSVLRIQRVVSVEIRVPESVGLESLQY